MPTAVASLSQDLPLATPSRPRSYARHLALEQILKVVGAALILASLITFDVYFYCAHRAAFTTAFIYTSAPAGLMLGLIASAKLRYQQISIGIRSEKRVSRLLSQISGLSHIDSVPLKYIGDADHVVFSPCLAVVETKTGFGPVKDTGRALIVGTRQIPGDPISQVLRQSRELSRRLGEHVSPVICIPDTTSTPFTTRQVTICCLRDLPNVLLSIAPTAHRRGEEHLRFMLRSLD